MSFIPNIKDFASRVRSRSLSLISWSNNAPEAGSQMDSDDDSREHSSRASSSDTDDPSAGQTAVSLSSPTINFLRFPPELRDEIYRQYIHDHFHLPIDKVWDYDQLFAGYSHFPDLQNRQPPLLTASRQVYAELCLVLCEHAILRVLPAITVYDMAQYVELDQVSALTIEIYAPSVNDQLARDKESGAHVMADFWRELLYVVKKLDNKEKLSKLRALNLTFVDIQWLDDDEIQRTLDCDEYGEEDSDTFGMSKWYDHQTKLPTAYLSDTYGITDVMNYSRSEGDLLWDEQKHGVYTDLHLILETFSLLTHFHKVKVHLPDGLENDERLISLAQVTEEVMVGRRPEAQQQIANRIRLVEAVLGSTNEPRPILGYDHPCDKRRRDRKRAEGQELEPDSSGQDTDEDEDEDSR